jgi:predicted nuclease with TOPRIM domain
MGMVDEPQRPTESRHALFSKGVGTFLLSAGFIFILALLIGAFQIAGVVNMGLAHMLVALAYVIAVFAVWGWLLSRPRKHIGKTVLLTALTLGIIFFGLDFLMVWLKAEQEHKPLPSVSAWLSSVTTYIQSLPWLWIAASLAVGLLVGAWLFRAFRHSKTANEVKKLQDLITESEGEKASLEGRIETLNAQFEEKRETLNAQHQSEKDRLEGQIEGLNREVDRLKNEVETQEVRVSTRQGEVDSLQATLDGSKWLHEIAEAQAKEINRYVTLIRVVMNLSLTSSEIAFYFHIRNKSNYAITIDVPPDDFIHFNGRALYYPIKLINKDFECPPSEDKELLIEQPLTKEEAERISGFEDGADFYFSLEHLNFFVRGVGSFAEIVTPQPLATTIKPVFPAPNVKELTDRIKELERGQAALEKVKSELETVKNRYGWLHKAEDAQARDIDEYVIVESVLLCGKRLDGDPPYIEFWLNVYNMSVFDLTVHKDEIGGRVTYRGERLREGKEIIYDENIIPSSKRRHLNVRQDLTQGQAESIAKYTDEVLEILLNFQEVEITVSGGTQFPQVRRKSLNMPQSIGTKYMAQLMKASRDESTDDEAVNAFPKLKIEILRAIYRGYVSQNEGILAMIVNLNVQLTDLQRNRIDITKFRLRVILQGVAYLSYAERGEIYESKFKDNKDEIKRGKRLHNLNYESPIGIEPEQPFGGWLQFFIDGQYASDADPTPSATLTVIDVLGREYSEDCTLRHNG